MLGYGVTSLAVNLIRALCLFSFPKKEGETTEFRGVLVYYIIGASFLLASAGLYYVERNNKFMQYFVELNKAREQELSKQAVSKYENFKDTLRIT